ncbi:hypothetical protein ACVJGD_000978 [Bradyrhizobium sp. USDA 10063]
MVTSVTNGVNKVGDELHEGVPQLDRATVRSPRPNASSYQSSPPSGLRLPVPL